MANIKLFDPFFADPFENAFKGMFRPLRVEMEEGPQIVKVDVEEQGNEYIVRAEIPGVKKEDINVQVEGNTISITGEVKHEKDVKSNGGKVLRSERYYGSVGRTFTVASDLDQAQAKAKYENGVLELTVPKKTGTAAKRISVQ